MGFIFIFLKFIFYKSDGLDWFLLNIIVVGYRSSKQVDLGQGYLGSSKKQVILNGLWNEYFFTQKEEMNFFYTNCKK